MKKFEELEMDTDSLYLALAEKELEASIQPEIKAVWEKLLSKECTDGFKDDAVGTFPPDVV